MAVPSEENSEREGGASHVGALLQASRQRLGEDLPDVALMLRIRLPYLAAIEAGRYRELPGATYAVGFIRAYAEHLGLDSEEVVRRFKVETIDGGSDQKLSFPTPVAETGIPGGAYVFVGLVVAVIAYGAWYVSATEDGFFAELISPLDEHISSLLSSDDDPAAATAPVTPAGVSKTPAAPQDIEPSANADRASDEPKPALEQPTPVPEETEPETTSAAPVTPAGAVESSQPVAQSEPAIADVEPEITETQLEPTAAVPAPATGSASSGGAENAGNEPQDQPTRSQAAAVETAPSPGSEVPPAQAVAVVRSQELSVVTQPATPQPAPDPSSQSATNEIDRPAPAAPSPAPAAPSPAPAAPSPAPAAPSIAVDSATEPDASSETRPLVASIETNTIEPTGATADIVSETVPAPVSLASGTESEIAAPELPTVPVQADTEANVAEAAEEPLIARTAPVQARIVINAKTNSWIQVRDDVANQMLITRLLTAGDSYEVPNRPGLILLTGNAGALEILVDGVAAPSIGGNGVVRRGVVLEADRLKQGTAVTN